MTLDHLGWSGAPEMVLHRPLETGTRIGEGCDFWRLSWVNAVSLFSKRFPPDFRISQDLGEGMILHGTRGWTDYRVAADVTLHLGTYGGLMIRAQGLRRYYAARVLRDGRFQIVCVKDEVTTILAEAPLAVRLETPIALTLEARGETLTASADGVILTASDGTFTNGALGLLIHEGALSTCAIHVSA